MSLMSSIKVGQLTQKLLLLTVSEKAIGHPGTVVAARRLHALTVKPSEEKDKQPICCSEPGGMSMLTYVPRVDYSTSFFVKHTAEQLWKGVTSVSNAGKKRGRGKGVGKKTAKDLNRGQVIGVGKANMVWPGLNAPIIQGKELVERRQLPPDTEREAKLLKMRDTMGQFRPLLLSPLERGWSGTKMHGRKIGPPDPIGEDKFEGFDTVVLEMKTVANMDANYGRVRRFSVLSFTGNGEGLAGFALAKSPDGRGALKRSKNRAGQKLVYIERHDGHTVLHDFYTRFGHTQIYVYKKGEGYGLVCHRAIKAMCQLIGIKNLYAKVHGSTNVQHIVKAFMLGLLRQKSHEQLSEEKGLYLVEQGSHMADEYPVVLAKPSTCRSEKEINHDETLDFSQVCFGDRIPVRKKKYVPFYQKLNLRGWENHLLKTEWRRNHPELLRYLLREHDGYKSYLTEKYPEADGTYFIKLDQKHKAEQENEDD